MFWAPVLSLPTADTQKPGCMFDTMGLQVRDAQDATVQGNINDICCTWKQGIILPLGILHHESPFAIVSSQRPWLRDAQRQRERGSEAKRESLPIDPGCLQPAFVSIRTEAALALLGEFDGQLSVCQSIMWFLSHNRSPSALLLISLLFRGMKIHIPPLHTDMDLSLPARLEEKWKSKWNTPKRKTIKSNRGKSSIWNFVMVKDRNSYCAVFLCQSEGKDS